MTPRSTQANADRTQLAEFRRAVYETAEAVAPGWERWRARIEEVTAPVREWMLDELEPRPGDTVLELAAGAGDTGFEAAALAGEHGRLISTDFSPAMVDVARRRGAELGLGNVDYRVMDAERIELDADSVDGVICRFAYMLMPDPAAALAETRRVLRPGGPSRTGGVGRARAQPVGHDRLRAPRRARPHTAARPRRPEPVRAGERASARGRCSRPRASPPCARRRSRFGSPSATSTTTATFTADTGGPAAQVLQGLPEDEREALKTQLRAAFAPFETGRTLRAPGRRAHRGRELRLTSAS